jgi:hypothetical protein
MTNIFTRAFLMAMLLTGIGAVQGRAQSLPSLPANQLVLPEKSFKVNFQWLGDSLNGAWEPHAALLLPVKLPFCTKQFYMQFDLGSPYSLFYSREIEEIGLKYPKALPTADANGVIKNCTFKVGAMPVTAREIVVRPSGNPHKSTNKKEVTIIGTIGTDFIDGRVILIDYPGLSIYNGITPPPNIKLPQSLPDFYYAGRSVLLPSVIQGRSTILFFDTGSSSFELITDKKTVEALADSNAVPAQYAVSSWNRTLTANVVAAKGSIVMASQNIRLNKVTYIEGASAAQVQQMMKMGIGGMIGNKLFINHKLLLDTRKKKFALIK